MKTTTILIFAYTLVVARVYAAVEADLVSSLPGYEGALPSNHYSGYISTGKLSGVAGQLHYWFIESTNDPANDPVVLWLNGGPGSSSLIGLLTENGQVHTNDESLTEPINGIPQVFYNPYNWATTANMLYLESPKGVGFSYCEEATSSSECVNTDESTAQDAYEFLVNFFNAYPEYKANKFYMTGESYAGIYIPMLMSQIDDDYYEANINLVGSAIGNGCWGNTVGTCSFSSPEAQQISADFFYGHGFYSQELRKEIVKSCGDWSRLSPRCLKALAKMEDEMGNFNTYNIYDECGKDQRRRKLSDRKITTDHSAPPTDGGDGDGNGNDLDQYEGVVAKWRQILSQKTVSVSTSESMTLNAGYGQALNDYACGGETAMSVWLDEPSVIEALHVKAGTVGMKYTKTADDLRPLYSELINKYQILIYSGDVDGCVPYVGSEAWTAGLNFTVIDKWHQWLAKDDQAEGGNIHKGGYAITYDKFQFVTINGAGHMVPEFQPNFALNMFKKFIAGDIF